MNSPLSSPNRRPSQFSAGSGRGELPLWAVLVVATGVLVLGIGGSRSASLSGLSSGSDGSPEDGSLAGIPLPIERMPKAERGVETTANQQLMASLVELGSADGARELMGAGPIGSEGSSGSEGESGLLVTVDSPAIETLSELLGDGHESSYADARHGGLLRVGLREEGSFQHGVRHGVWKGWREDGTLRSQGQYVNGLREGVWQAYSESGSLLSELSFAAGSRHGEWHSYSETGSILEEGQYSENTATGRWTTYYSGGQIKERGLFVNGLREGHWEFYDDLGLPTLEAGEYRAGIKVQ